MSLISERNKRLDEVLKGKFIHSKLEETSKEIEALQRKEIASFNSSFWNNRSFRVSNGQLIYTHDKRHRYLDMKTRANKTGSKKKKKSRSIHNKIIWGQYNYLIRELSFGYTEAVKNNIKNIEE